MDYNAQDFEKKCYEIWEKKGYFEVDSNKSIANGKDFCIMMPPPNITGSLHIGHALTYTLQDIITRFKRMEGFRTLWQPGIDHAGIATQNVVERQLLAKGIKKEQIGREAFLREVWAWKEKSGGDIIAQLKRLGASATWSRTRFTMDKGLQNAVKKAFVTWYERGLIFQGDYMVNWCTHDGALSDIEVEFEANEGKLYYLKYFLKDSNECVVVATTRPETYFGDTAVMVNPNDERFTHLIGQKVVLPLIEREIDIIADEVVDMEFGTGAVKVTPAHDNNDYEVGLRHKLEFITIFDKQGILNGHCGEFEGLERLEARDKIVERLKSGGFVEKIEDYTNQVGKCYRCGNIVEPYISRQWFVSKDIAKETIRRVNAGECKFYPNQWINNFNAWMNDLRDWCISRQLWWGHRIPIFYCDLCGIKIASEKDAENCPKCGEKMRQDEDVLDTWFSSGLWAFSTLGWNNNLDSNAIVENDKGGESKPLFTKSDLNHFYPNSLLITSFDILFFWVARMLFSGESLLGKLPFKDIYLHALVCDENGKKMSKSRGNVINPLVLIDTHSSDILRFSLAYNCIQGRDIKIGENSLNIGNALVVKIINALNFLLMYKDQQNECSSSTRSFTMLNEIDSPLGLYIYAKFNLCVQEVKSALDSYRFNDAANALYRFLFNDFCDFGIEAVKAQKDSVFEMGAILGETMKLLHPFMPFVSEFVWQSLRGTSIDDSSSIMIERFPIFNANLMLNNDFEIMRDVITSIRRAKTNIDLANRQISQAFIKADLSNKSLAEIFIKKLAKCEKVNFVESKIQNCIFEIGELCEVYIPAETVDLNALIKKLETRALKIQTEKTKLESMLNNENFIKNAPKNLIEINRNALNDAKTRLERIQAELESLKSIGKDNAKS